MIRMAKNNRLQNITEILTLGARKYRITLKKKKRVQHVRAGRMRHGW